MDDLIEFLKARLAEDEAIARYFRNEEDEYHWTVRKLEGPGYGTDEARIIQLSDSVDRGYVHLGMDRLNGWDARHIARHDPARVLREVEAKRRILELHVFGERVCDQCSNDWHTEMRPCLTLRALALPFADHPDYREEWKV